MDPAEIEGLAVWLYQRHGLDPETAAPWRCFVPVLERPRHAGLAYSFGDTIARHRMRPEYEGFVALHEHAHIVFREHRILFASEQDEEMGADHLAACLLAPRPAVRAFARTYGRDHEVLAAVAEGTKIWARLRFAETFGESLAVVGPSMTWARGEFVGVEESNLRALVRSPPSGLRVVRTGRAWMVIPTE